MIPLSRPLVQQKSWQQQLSSAFKQPQRLLEYLQLDQHAQISEPLAHQQFKTLVTQDFADCMHKGDPDDPLLRQVLPVNAELEAQPAHFNSDPVGDLLAEAAPGVLHKYPSRVLLISTAACAIHCRYCFRRHFPYQESTAHLSRLSEGLAYIRKNPQINEVILSGGDPLILADEQLEKLIAELEQIAHVKTLRIHSRLPVVLPDRLNLSLKKLLERSRLQSVLVIHSNHYRELSDKVQNALSQFQFDRLTLLNQAVLLNGVNNDADTLSKLSHRLFACRVLPYYLHMPDAVTGSAHFHVSSEEAALLMHQIRCQLPGYLVPKLVLDLPASHYKKNPF